ncbi:MAG: C13 family peptidase [Betaproteobacteria bacterium]
MPLQSFVNDLRRNLSAGLRLALLRPVALLDFRVTAPQFLALAVFGALCASLVDLTILGGSAQFSSAGIGGHVRDSALLLLLCWGIATWLRAPSAALALPVVFLAAGWFPDLVFAAILAAPAALGLSGGWQYSALWWAVLAWSLVVAWRSIGVVIDGGRRHAPLARVLAVAVLFGGVLLIALVFPAQRLWEEAPAVAAVDPDAEKLPPVESEEVMAAQPRLLFEALTGLEERTPGKSNLYFVGFAGDASQDVFRNDMESAQEVVDAQLGTEGRSVILVNSPKTVLDAPLATLTNLQASLTTLGKVLDADEDIAMLYLSSHGSADHQLFVNFPPLKLQQLTPIGLHRMLQESGIKFKVVIVSACYSGGFVEPLKDPDTVVITSSRADRTSFGCDNGSEFTYFGQAYFQEALKKTTSLLDAFELARAAIAERERTEGLTPSEPQLYVGDAIRTRLGGKARNATIADLSPANR